ncbi:MAG: hypothetical protein EOO43_16300 [Flavobacterium sp.]|nr:MAG: hypothetical protein EOO43_16300 [Flavobacterium sp.]
MLKVFYYNYYLFYTRILVQPEPHLVTTLALSASFSFILNGIIDITLIKLCCYNIGKWPMITMHGVILFLIYLYFHRINNAHDIVKSKPKVAGSQKASIIFSILLFLLTILSLFVVPILGKRLLESC